MKKLFLLCAFVIAAVCTAPLEAMNKRNRADSSTEEDYRVKPDPRQTKMTQYYASQGPIEGIPAPNLDSLRMPNKVQDNTPPAPNPTRVLAPNTWWHRYVAERLNELNQHNL